MFKRCSLIALLSLLCSVPFCFGAASDQSRGEWHFIGGDQGSAHFSPLAQISRENVGALRPVWHFSTGGLDAHRNTAMECTPLMVKGVLYVTSPVLEVIALDAQTGRELWRFNPFPKRITYHRLVTLICIALLGVVALRTVQLRSEERIRVSASVAVLGLISLTSLNTRLQHWLLPDANEAERYSGPNRGLSYWHEGKDARIIFAGGHHLIELNADTGQPVTGFGMGGRIDLLTTLPGRHDLPYAVTSPVAIFQDVLVLGSAVGEGPGAVASGDLQAFDARSGRRLWTHHAVPHPGEAGSETWPDGAWKRVGAANAWAGMSVDEQRGWVFVPTGSAAFDFYGGDRQGSNLGSDSLVVLNARSGKLVWQYQVVHHDLWDYDLPCPPLLTTVNQGAASRDVVVQPTKQGYLFVLDRKTGQPLFPVVEREVPKSSIPGENAWPTQPVPLLPEPVVRQTISEADLTSISPAAHAEAVQSLRSLDAAHVFAPPSSHGTLVVPGFLGGIGWGGASYNRNQDVLVVNSSELPFRLRLKKLTGSPGYTAFNFDDPFVDRGGYPAIQPPWGHLTAISLASGQRLWDVPLGEFPELSRKGIPVTGTPNIGGSLQTAGELVFLAATMDRQFRAFDVRSGRILWSWTLPAAGHASPATYECDGQQYVVIAAGGGSIVESKPSGDQYVAFSLAKH